MKTLPDWFLAEMAESERRQLKAERLAKIENLARQASILTSPNDLFLSLHKQTELTRKP